MDPQGNGQRNGCLICTEPAENVYLESADEALKPSISGKTTPYPWSYNLMIIPHPPYLPRPHTHAVAEQQP
ncbi:unnamed protein product [Cercospora beticola]|nr:unnamed protein product [Cercospora beticola]